jgi:hypothetical protein
MLLDNQYMLDLTSRMPMKQINLEKPYLQRYFARSTGDYDIWFHRFLSADGDRFVHSHPFEFYTTVLCGGYTEEWVSTNGDRGLRIREPRGDTKLLVLSALCIMDKKFQNAAIEDSPSFRKVGLYDWHRIVEVQPDTWTVLFVDKRRLKTWHFMGDDGAITTEMASARDWYKNFKPRGQNQGDVC